MDLKAKNNASLDMATIEPLYWDYLRLIYDVVKANRFMPIFIFSNRSSATHYKT